MPEPSEPSSNPEPTASKASITEMHPANEHAVPIATTQPSATIDTPSPSTDPSVNAKEHQLRAAQHQAAYYKSQNAGRAGHAGAQVATAGAAGTAWNPFLVASAGAYPVVPMPPVAIGGADAPASNTDGGEAGGVKRSAHEAAPSQPPAKGMKKGPDSAMHQAPMRPPTAHSTHTTMHAAHACDAPPAVPMPISGGLYTPALHLDPGSEGDAAAIGGEGLSLDSLKQRERKRLEQNREAAKRFRAKKKNLMSELQDAVSALREENSALRSQLHDSGAAGQAPLAGGAEGKSDGGGVRLLPQAIQKVHDWWSTTEAIATRLQAARPQGATDPDAAIAQLLPAVVALPDLLRTAIAEGHSLHVCNLDFCPHPLRFILWNGSLKPSECIDRALAHVLSPSSPNITKIFGLRSHYLEQENMCDHAIMSALADARRRLGDAADRDTLPQFTPYIAAYYVQAAQIHAMFVTQLQQVLPPTEFLDSMLLWVTSITAFKPVAAIVSKESIEMALALTAPPPTAPPAAPTPEDAAEAFARASMPHGAPMAVLDPHFIAAQQAHAASLAMQYAAARSAEGHGAQPLAADANASGMQAVGNGKDGHSQQGGGYDGDAVGHTADDAT